MSTGGNAPTESAVVVLVPVADRLVAAHRQDLDPTAAWGVPAHVTVLYPFLAPDRLDESVLATLATAVAGIGPFTAELRRAALVDDGYLWLLPEPERSFRQIQSAVHDAFPEQLPYGGKHHDPTPHLTVGQDVADGTARLRAAYADVTAGLPLRQEIATVAVIAGARSPDSWRTVGEVPLGGRVTRPGGPGARRVDP